MSEPVRRSYSQEEMLDLARKWMSEVYGEPKSMTLDQTAEKARWYERYGMLIDFITEMFPS